MRARLRPAALVLVSALALGGVVAIAAPAAAVPENQDQLSVTLAGDNATGVAASDAAAVSIATYSAQGDQLGTVPLPTAASGANQPFALNADEGQQGILEQSTDHTHVVLGGYATTPGPVAVGLNGTSAASVPRVVASIDKNGVVDTSTTLGNAFDGSHIRGVASTDGKHFWAGGKGDNTSPYGGVVYAQDGATNSTTVVGSGAAGASANTDNGRVPVISDGQLYVGSDKKGNKGINVVGTGLPTTTATSTTVAAEPSANNTAQGYVFAGGALYVAYTAGTPGIVRYVKSGSTWTSEGVVAQGLYWGLTGRVAGDGVVLYATSNGFGNKLVELYDAAPTGAAAALPSTTIATAPANREFRGVAFAAGYVPPTTAVPAPDATPTFSWTASDLAGEPTADGSLTDVVGTLGTKQVAVTDPSGFAIASVAVTGSSNTAVVDPASTTVTGSAGSYTVGVTPAAAGRTTLTLTATTKDGRTGTSTLVVGALAAARTGDELHFGSSDASAAVAVGDGYTLVGDDDTTAIRLYGPSGYETKAFDFASQVGIIEADESWDTESVSQDGNTLYWLGSLGPSRKGNVKPDRDTIVETKIVGSGASTTLQYVASRHGIVSALEKWDDNSNGSRFGFTEAMTSGAVVGTDHSLNVEGSAIAPDGSLWLAFRSPLVKTDGTVGTGGGTDALVVSIDNLAAMMGSTSVTPHVAGAFTLDLGGRAFRDIRRTDDGNYLISAGGADDVNHWALFGWDGKPADAPVKAADVETGRGLGGSWEGIASVPSLADGTETEIVQDDGTVELYGDGTAAQDEPSQDLKAFTSSVMTLDFGGAFGTVAGGGSTGGNGGGSTGGNGGGSTGGGSTGGTGSGSTTHPTFSLSGALRVGGTFTVHGSGFAAGEQIQVWLHSDPVLLGTLTATADGTLDGSVTIPSATAAGAHTILLTGPVSGTVSEAITVDPAVGTASALAFTGSDGAMLAGGAAAGLLLLLAGVGLLVARRRRGAVA